VRATAVRAPLLAPDPGVPGRDVLLDAGQMSGRLSRLLGRDGPAGIDRYARGRAKYKVGESLRVVHEIEIDGTPWIVASRTFPDGRSERVYERALAETRDDGGPLLGVAHDPELHAVFWTFPNDRKLATLPALLPATDTVSALLGRPIARTVLAAYAPEKSATAACFDELLGRPVAYAKVFADPPSSATSASASPRTSPRPAGRCSPSCRRRSCARCIPTGRRSRRGIRRASRPSRMPPAGATDG